MKIPDVSTFAKSPGCDTHQLVWDFLKTRPVYIIFKAPKRKILLDKLDRYINAMRAWNLVLTDQKYVMGDNLIAEERRKKIVLDGLWFQQAAADIRVTHPSPDTEQIDESGGTAPTPRLNSAPKKGGRPKEGRTKWVEGQYRDGLTPAQILDKWDGMSDETRKSIDKKKWRPFVSARLTDEDAIAAARKRARASIEKMRPKRSDS